MTVKAKSFLVVTIFMTSGFINTALSQSYYVSVDIGLGMLQQSSLTDDVAISGTNLDLDYDYGFVFSGAVGLIRNNFRAELEYGAQFNDLDKIGINGTRIDSESIGLKGDITANSFFINGYYDFNTRSDLTPYLSAGFGFEIIDLELSFDDPDLGSITANDDDAVLSGLIGAGITYQISEMMMIDLRYRYVFGEKPEFDSTTIEYRTHNFMGGLRVNF